MKKNIQLYAQQTIRDYFEAIYTLISFFPYFFSFVPLLKTLFYPWKHIVTKKEIRGFSFSEYFSRLFLNSMSSCIGATMRLTILIFCVMFEIVYILSLPLITFIYVLIFLPIQLIIFYVQPTKEELKEREKKVFLTSHCLKEENTLVVTTWFEEIWKKQDESTKWWDKKILFSYPPLARDWAVGYTPTLDTYVEDLASVEYQSVPRHIVGRKIELSQIQDILSKSEEANVVLVGEEGVGKRTVVDALARLIYEGQTGKLLAYKRILRLNMEKILTTFTDIKQRELFFEELLREAAEAKSVILLIENVDKYCAIGDGRVDLTIPLEKFARLPALQFIGITTPFFYERFIFPNEKIARLFDRVDVKEISQQEALTTLFHIIPTYEKKYSSVIPYETAVNVIEKSEFYITSIPFPEKAIELLDQICAHYAKEPVIKPEYVDAILTAKTHIPTRLTEEMRAKLLRLESLLGERVLFQNEAVSALSSALRRSFILLGKRKKPLATFLFLGPTGVGKTETAKALSTLFFGDDTFLTRFDMSLYQSKDDIKTLIGSLESGLPGILTQAIREKPYGVLLLDELEKAHPDLINIFLTVIDEGYFTDGFGKRVDCKNLIVIATSNAGAEYIHKQNTVLNKITTVIDGDTSEMSTNNVNGLIDYLITNKIYSPEFLNRFDGVVEYNSISDQALLLLAKKMSQSVQDTMYAMYKIRILVKDETLLEIVKKHYNPALGARNLDHVVTQEIEDKIATLLLQNKIAEGAVITV